MFRALSALSALKTAVLISTAMAVLPPAWLSAQTPDPTLAGEYGSNKSPTAEDPATPEPGDAGEPWSHHLNPWAHPGVANHLGLLSGAGMGVRTYGETTKDAYPLKPLNGLAKKAAYKSTSIKTWTVGNFMYKRQHVTLKSGALLVIFRPLCRDGR